MTLPLDEALRVVAEASLPGSSISVPREVLLSVLATSPNPTTQVLRRDLSVEEVGEHFGRSPGTVRAWIDAGYFPGAYKLRGKAWRIPPEGLSAMTKHTRTAHNRPETAPEVKLDAWRRPN
jgi:hypothetical protein